MGRVQGRQSKNRLCLAWLHTAPTAENPRIQNLVAGIVERRNKITVLKLTDSYNDKWQELCTQTVEGQTLAVRCVELQCKDAVISQVLYLNMWAVVLNKKYLLFVQNDTRYSKPIVLDWQVCAIQVMNYSNEIFL